MEALPRIPTEADIHALPHWAKIALAGRCAERVIPLIQHDWPDLPHGAMLFVGAAAQNAVLSAEFANATSASRDRDRIAAMVEQAANEGHNAAANALGVCVIACGMPPIADTRKTTNLALMAVEHAANAIQAVGLPYGIAVGAIWSDFVTIRDSAKSGNWTNETPVPPEAFGDLWPNGMPPKYPQEAAE